MHHDVLAVRSGHGRVRRAGGGVIAGDGDTLRRYLGVVGITHASNEIINDMQLISLKHASEGLDAKGLQFGLDNVATLCKHRSMKSLDSYQFFN